MWPWRSSVTVGYYSDLSFRSKAFSSISAIVDLSLFLLQFLLQQIWHPSRVHTVWQLHGVESVPYYSISTWPCSLFWVDAKLRATCFYDGPICAAAEALAQKKKKIKHLKGKCFCSEFNQVLEMYDVFMRVVVVYNISYHTSFFFFSPDNFPKSSLGNH